MPRPPPRTRASEIRQRLGTYALGLAIGCLLVMMLLMLRRQMLPNGPSPAQTAPPPSATGP
jgi:hypothetical protein